MTIQTTDAAAAADPKPECNSDKCLAVLSSLAESIAIVAKTLAALGCNSNKKNETVKPPVVVDKCENLKEGKEYYLKSADGKFAVVDMVKQLGFMKQVDSKNASKFKGTKLGCNLYGLCVDGFCMSRCAGCRPDTGEVQSVKFHATNTNGAYSKWTFVPTGSAGEYNLKIDESFGYLTYKATPSGDLQLTLATQLSNETKFKFIEVK